jgi:hypothetical protein
MLFSRVLALALTLTAAAVPNDVAAAGEPVGYYLPAGVAYDPKVPTPDAFLGHGLGEWHLRSDQLTAYLQAVAAAAPDRVRLEVVGRTHEFKPLLLLTISSPRQLRDLERVRENHLSLLDPAKADALDLARLPVVVSLGYAIHGNEPGTHNAVPAVVYHLAAARGEEIERWLEEMVILIEPLRNPDGADRFAHWANTHKGVTLTADPISREHLEVWPRGRMNHYWFDPNRDWLPLVHPEAQARADIFHRWRPNVLTDHHEMGTNSTFFFQPGVPTRNNPLIAREVTELTARIADFHARAFDAQGLLYFSEQQFDDFYPGKGSTYPDLHGSVGILFEQGSSRGHLQESDNGPLRFSDTIRSQALVSFSTLRAAYALRRELLELQRAHTPAALALARQSKVKAHLFSDDGDPQRAAAMIELLLRHRLEVRPLAAEVRSGGVVFAPGAAWVVPVEQAQYRLVTEIMGRRTEFPDPVFYDVSAWSVPLGFNLPCVELDRMPAAAAALRSPPTVDAARVGGRSEYAYLMPWSPYLAPRALHRLQKEGIRVKGLTAPIEAVAADGTRRTFDRGTVLVPLGQQPGKRADIERILDRIVAEDRVSVYAVNTGLTPSGVDLGSSSFVPLPTLSVALLVGEGVDAYDAGEAWHLLDVRVGTAVTLLDLANLPRAELGRYTGLVMVDGTYDGISDTTVEGLRRWIRSGGTLVALGRAAEWAAKKELARAEFERTVADGAHVPAGSSGGGKAAAEEAPKAGTTEPVRRQPYARADDLEAMRRVEGAIFATRIDVTHPLGYGYRAAPGETEANLPLFRTSMLRLKPSRSPYETPVIYTEQPLLAGYVSEQNLRRLSRTAGAVAQAVGSGAVVLIPDNPNFRGYWYGGNRLFLNALIYGRAIRPPRTPGDDQ